MEFALVMGVIAKKLKRKTKLGRTKLNMSNDKLRDLHNILCEKLLEKINDPDAKSADLNVARQFLRDNGIDAVPTDDSPLQRLIDETPFNEKKQVVKN